ncbi:hypothetical protein Sjap_005804 [Stephania japonica]|uniref:Aminotransferase-like plant mobile domain-containing protein n=1 Tax=Stephania japonica TaxID=461633 RepID=A0AAP0PM85_9MAGN
MKVATLAFLYRQLSIASHASPDVYPSPECLVQAYLLYLLGTTLFLNKSGRKVSLSLLQLLEHVDKIGSYAWGLQHLHSCTVN